MIAMRGVRISRARFADLAMANADAAASALQEATWRRRLSRSPPAASSFLPTTSLPMYETTSGSAVARRAVHPVYA
jgi:hypothetical protein